MRTGYQYVPSTWTVGHVTLIHADTLLIIIFHAHSLTPPAEWISGGSLDRYGTIPEEVLGRITVAVS